MYQTLRQIIRVGIRTEATPTPAAEDVVVKRLHADILRTLGRALTIRHVDAGSCNACELEAHALSNPYYNIEGLGIKFVASPRHADALLVTGPVSKHMAIALQRTYDATPEPKLVIAAGECARGGGIFGESYATIGAVSKLLPVDVAIPGCPPSPAALLAGILAAIDAVAPSPPEAEPTLDADAGASRARTGASDRAGGESDAPDALPRQAT
jgi:Ni,Fe-hydrogenase III small subunit